MNSSFTLASLSRRCVRARSDTGDGPIKIGFIVPLSGPFAQNGRDILNGFLLCSTRSATAPAAGRFSSSSKTTRRFRL